MSQKSVADSTDHVEVLGHDVERGACYQVRIGKKMFWTQSDPKPINNQGLSAYFSIIREKLKVELDSMGLQGEAIVHEIAINFQC
jgi:hypothetical protein